METCDGVMAKGGRWPLKFSEHTIINDNIQYPMGLDSLENNDFISL